MRVPNAPCGVESFVFLQKGGRASAFLMHRVELKATLTVLHYIKNYVPNAPCGVESWVWGEATKPSSPVPNAPCGVERSPYLKVAVLSSSFLMHRVELKDRDDIRSELDSFRVPNAPCGVERLKLHYDEKSQRLSS